MLYDAINTVKIELKKGKNEIKNLRYSKYIFAYFSKLKALGYIKKLKINNDKKFKSIEILLGPKLLDIKYNKIEKSIKLADIVAQMSVLDRGIGHLLISTSKGILSGEQALKNKIGGINLGYVY